MDVAVIGVYNKTDPTEQDVANIYDVGVAQTLNHNTRTCAAWVRSLRSAAIYMVRPLGHSC